MRQRIYFSLLNEHIFRLSSLIGAFGSGGLLIAIGNYNKLIAMRKSMGRIRNIALKEPYSEAFSTLSDPTNTVTAQSTIIYHTRVVFMLNVKGGIRQNVELLFSNKTDFKKWFSTISIFVLFSSTISQHLQMKMQAKYIRISLVF